MGRVWNRDRVCCRRISGRWLAVVYSSTAIKKVLEEGGVQDVHCAYHPSMFDLVDCVEYCRVHRGIFTVSEWIFKRIKSMKWFMTLDEWVKSKVLWRNLKSFKFWTEDMKYVVRRMWIEGMRIADICAFLYSRYYHKIKVKTLLFKFCLWGWIKFRKPPRIKPCF